MQTIIVKENDVNQRLDNFLGKVFSHLPKTLIYKLIRTKQIKVNQKKVDLNYRLQLNDEIKIFSSALSLASKEDKKDPDFFYAKKKLDVVYEDKNIIVVNKPINLVVHADDSNTKDTLINRIQWYLYQKKEYDPLKENQFSPTLAHRIDQNTSGLVIAAKNMSALQALNEIFKNHEIKKYYLTLVYGLLTPLKNTIKNYIKKEDKFVKVYHSYQPDAKEAITHYKVLEYLKNKFSLVEVELETGRTHQIRATFNDLNFPLVGEQKYIKKTVDKDPRFKHQALVAYKLIFKIRNIDNPLFYLNEHPLSLNLNEIDFLKKLS